MRSSTTSSIALLLLGTASLLAQTKASLSGTVTGSDGRRIASAIVTAMGTSKLPWSVANSTSGPDGSFSFFNLPPGPYRLCVQVPAGGYLDPCSWSPIPPTVTLTAGQPATAFPLKTLAGSVLKVRLNDPASVLKSAVNLSPPVVLGVHTAAALFVPFVLRARDSTGSDHEVTIPFNVPVKVSVQSRQLSLAKSDGTPVVAGNAISVTHSSAPGPPPPALTFQITGTRP
jgi:hypothetical protein